MTPYDNSIREEELKNKVTKDWFARYDTTQIVDNIDLEIGLLFKGQEQTAQQSYIEDIASILNNYRRYLIADNNIFLVANAKNNLYPRIIDLAGMTVNRFKRPVQTVPNATK